MHLVIEEHFCKEKKVVFHLSPDWVGHSFFHCSEDVFQSPLIVERGASTLVTRK